MPRVKFYAPLRFNLTGYDREPVQYDKGTHEVPDVVAAWVARNPAVGEVVKAEPKGKAAKAAEESEGE